MLRIAICDDMADQQLWILELIEHWEDRPYGMTTEIFSDGDSLITAHKAKPFDIILLDIIMPMLNGIDTAAELRKTDRNVRIIFLTSTSEFAVDSYAVRADNYLLKPADPERLYGCLGEIIEEMGENNQFITVNSKGALRRISMRSIEYVEASGKKELISLTDGSLIEAANPHYFFEKNLPAKYGFFKCHRSYIVNMHQIDTYTPKEIIMQSGARIPISRGLNKAFEEAFFNLMFS